ncbi:metal ABC transporter substrate-binding protein [Nocardioides stalactiti]|uniref:metal ABC transporter substrate-binding protein n=1 Tax=Nocardioides stalactiti TaxID=2755356 RepID=UPI0015FF840B|nr:metal ABC transporter substrate-binding protein [Nocardioides stalactiti]
MRFGIAVVPLTALALVATGCSAFEESGADPSDGVTVAAAFYPLAYVAERVAGDHAEVTLLTQPGTEPHDLELAVDETAEIAGADLVLFEHGFQPAVDDAVEQNAGGVPLDAAEVVGLLPAEESPEEHAEHEDEHEDEHDHGDVDPHFWQDPVRVADLGDAVADELAEIDPGHAEDYTANAAALRADLAALDELFTTGLADCARDTVVVSHDAFGYLEKYGVRIAPLVGLSPDAEPSPAVLGEVQELILDEGITTVFSEPLEPDLVAGLAADLDLATGSLDPIEGLTDSSSGEDYVSLMESNLAAIRAANECR